MEPGISRCCFIAADERWATVTPTRAIPLCARKWQGAIRRCSCMAERLGHALVALSLVSIAFASMTFVCGAIHAVLGVRSPWIYELPGLSFFWWLGAQAAIVTVWPLFLAAGKARARRHAGDDVGTWVIMWPITVAASLAIVYLWVGVTECGWCDCSMHEHTWADLLWIVAASVLPAWRITLVRALWPAPRITHVRASHADPVSG